MANLIVAAFPSRLSRYNVLGFAGVAYERRGFEALSIAVVLAAATLVTYPKFWALLLAACRTRGVSDR
jgi:hypothetical protein